MLEALESARRYNRWIADLTLPFLGEHPLEIGSGIGVSAALWLESGLPAITTTELDPDALRRLHDRFDSDARVTVMPMNLEEAPDARHSAVVALNVLEHIEDDCGALRGAARLVRPGGRVVMLVPAFPFATGRFDRLIGHYRRYTIGTISRVFAEAGIPARVRALRECAPASRRGFSESASSEDRFSYGRLLRMWDRLVIPVARKVEGRWTPPFGQSVLAVGRSSGPPPSHGLQSHRERTAS